jgi:hypothetical protein
VVVEPCCFRNANQWNTRYADGLGRYYVLRSGVAVLFPTAPFGICLSDVLSPDFPSRDMTLDMDGHGYHLKGRDGHRDMCLVVIYQNQEGGLNEQLWLVKDDDLAGRFIASATAGSIDGSIPETGCYLWFHDRFY